jgi:hypothetical protein
MYWLGAQNDEGRLAQTGYLAVASLLVAAHSAGAAAVNLGASAGLPGVAQFKELLGGVSSPVLEWRDSSTLISLLDSTQAALQTRRG